MKATFLLLLATSTTTLVWGYTTSDTGAGVIYTLSDVADSWLEWSHYFHRGNKYISVGFHPGFPKKRSLVQFENLPGSCSNVQSAKLYLYFHYAHKASWHPITYTPYITRTLEVHQVLKSWRENEVTKHKRYNGAPWSVEYLGGNDFDAHVDDSVVMHPDRPSGYVEFDITETMRNWKNGSPNYGLLIKILNEDNPGRDLRFYSRENADTGVRPMVKVLCN